MSGILQRPLGAEAPPAIILRPPRARDQGYVCSTWWRNVRPQPRPETLNAILDHETTKLIVAGCHGDPDFVAGWICWSLLGKAPLLHFVYVRAGKRGNYRGQGVARALVTAAGLDLTRPIAYTMPGFEAASLLERFRGVHIPVEQFLR